MKRQIRCSTMEEDLLRLQAQARLSPLSISQILAILSKRGQSLILIFLSLPFCQPLQIPGMSTPFGLVIAFIGLGMVFGKDLWLPKKLRERQISSAIVEKITDKTLWVLRRAKRWIHPRLLNLCRNFFIQVVNGLLIALLGLILAMPLPIPFSNLMAAWALFFIGLGMVEDDGLFMILGYLIALLTFGFFAALLFSIKLLF